MSDLPQPDVERRQRRRGRPIDLGARPTVMGPLRGRVARVISLFVLATALQAAARPRAAVVELRAAFARPSDPLARWRGSSGTAARGRGGALGLVGVAADAGLRSPRDRRWPAAAPPRGGAPLSARHRATPRSAMTMSASLGGSGNDEIIPPASADGGAPVPPPPPPQLYPQRWVQLTYLSLFALLSDWVCFSIAATPETWTNYFGHDPATLIDVFLFTNVVGCLTVSDLVKVGVRATTPRRERGRRDGAPPARSFVRSFVRAMVVVRPRAPLDRSSLGNPDRAAVCSSRTGGSSCVRFLTRTTL